MSIKLASLGLAAIAVAVAGIAARPALAQNAQFQQPSVVAGPSSPGNGNAFVAQQGGGGTAGPRTGSDRIDLSVCDLATFDFDKCLN